MIQEAYAEAATRYDEYCNEKKVLLIRLVAISDPAKTGSNSPAPHQSSSEKCSTRGDSTKAITSRDFGNHGGRIFGKATTPVDAILLAETKQKITEALDRLKESDREILAMRHFEQMENHEVAESLEISKESAYKRYVRALKRLKSELGELPISFSLNR